MENFLILLDSVVQKLIIRARMYNILINGVIEILQHLSAERSGEILLFRLLSVERNFSRIS